ncbi:MAG: WecB/TagA/CpsF family glycosyltransferase [Planctomycetaceae bacterium]
MSSTAANSDPLVATSSAVVTPRPVTAQDAWNTPIFAFPGPPLPAGHDEARVTPDPSRPAVAEPCLEIPVSSVLVNAAAAEQIAPAKDIATVQAPSTCATLSPRPRFERGETSEIWGLRLDRVRMDETVDAIAAMIAQRTPRYIITANLNYAMLLDQDASLQAVTDDASLILADGQPLVWRSRIGSAGRLPERVAGSELIYRIAERAAQCGWRIYFLGAEAGVAQRCAQTLVDRYPGLVIAGVQSPPYRTLTESEKQQQRQSIIDSRADILLVAFGQPKGERWIHQHYQELGVPVSIQVGASFDFVAGTAKRAPKLWQRLGLEWCYRMFSDPWRLVPRYASNTAFLFLSLIRDWRDYVDDRFGEPISGPPAVSR